ncbi:MAG: copper amine oxidase N-terminal domain-containing protein [Syntrophomonas sp.]|nr:copper amine oxidase N-terminal domain-containing protein [Syntrophomonas sp.]
MYYKKWVALVLILMLAIGTLTGCSPAEKEYYNLTMEVNNQKVYEDSGSIELSLIQLPDSMFEGEKSLTKEMLKKAINQHRIDYLVKADLNQGIFQYDFTIVDNATGETSAFSSLTYKNDVLYIKVDDMISYLKKFGDSESNQKLDQLFGDVQYVSVSSQDLEDMMPPGTKQSFSGNFLQKSSQQQLVMRRLFDGLLYEVYDKYESDMISKNNNKYSLTLRGIDSIKIMKPVAVYTINNIDKLGLVLQGFLNSLNQAEFASLGLPGEIKDEALPGIDMMVLMVNQNRDKYLNEIENMSTSAQQDLAKTVNDSELFSTIEKKDSKTYDMTSKLHVHIAAGTPMEEVDFAFNIKQTMKVISAIQVASPTGKITTYKDLESRMPKQIDVKVDYNMYTFSQGLRNTIGQINVRLENNQAYLPLRLVAESMGDNVGWDETSQQAYVEQYGQRILMTGMVVDNEILVKSRDFESLSYKVSWNDSTRTITIVK